VKKAHIIVNPVFVRGQERKPYMFKFPRVARSIHFIFGLVILLSVLLISSPARGETNEAVVFPDADYSPLTPGGKFNHYLKSTVGPMSIFASAFSSGYNQAVDSGPEWGQEMQGYGKRFASSMGQKAVGNTVTGSLKILMREDPRYFHSNRQGIRARTLYAIGETFVARRDSGGVRPNYSWFAGTASGVYVSRQWRPESSRTATDYITGAAASVGGEVAKNVFNEFWPDIRRKLLKR